MNSQDILTSVIPQGELQSFWMALCNIYMSCCPAAEADFDPESLPVSLRLLPGAGSSRRYYRLTIADGITLILTVGDDLAENRAFCRLAEVFGEAEVRVPKVVWHATDYSCYLQTDLADRSLMDEIREVRKSGGESRFLTDCIESALTQLVRMQTVDESLWHEAVGFTPFSRRLVMWDLNYFKYEFLKPAEITFDEAALEDDFECLATDLLSLPEEYQGFMMRDFQSRNVMVDYDGRASLIDFQGGRKGPLIYDIISFLWQAKAGFSADERTYWFERYLELLQSRRNIDMQVMRQALPLFALFRTLQVLGAYGFRGLVQHKAHFVESIPAAMENLAELIGNGLERYPELSAVCARLLAVEKYRHATPAEGLTVEVYSFSYKKGYPEDLSGNGGGFMFDCRAMHNPGRYAEYKTQTGMDQGVIDFLEERGEVQEFLRAAESLVLPAVERYMQRGFSKLQVGFGCTGGQHRSVYCAQHLADDLHRRFPDLRIRLRHREQGIDRIL